MSEVSRAGAGRRAGAAVPAAGGRGGRAARWLTPAGPAAVALAAGLWRLTGPGMWRDEAVTYSVARRGLGQLWRLTGHVDAVHGVYYLLVHLVFAVFGPSVQALRMPSVLAGAATAGLLGAIGGRLGNRRAGLLAGLFWAVLPQVSRFLQEGRSYALVSLCVVAAGYFLLRRAWPAFAGAVALATAFNLLAVLSLAAFAATLLLWWAQRAVERRVLVPAAVAMAAAVLVGAVPVALRGRGQSGAMIGWIPRPTGQTWLDLLHTMSGSVRMTLPVVLVALTGCARLLARAGRSARRAGGPVSGDRSGELVALAVPLAVLPPALLIGYSLVVSPAYVTRYVLFALAGSSLLVGLGLDTLLGPLAALAARAPGTRSANGRAAGAIALVAGVLAVAVVAVPGRPEQRHIRSVDGHGDPLLREARLIGRNARPGDAVLFLPAESRYTALAYPADFRDAADVMLAVTPAAAADLAGTDYPPDRLADRLAGHHRVWVVWNGAKSAPRPPDVPRLTTDGYRLARSWAVWPTRVVRLYVTAG